MGKKIYKGAVIVLLVGILITAMECFHYAKMINKKVLDIRTHQIVVEK